MGDVCFICGGSVHNDRFLNLVLWDNQWSATRLPFLGPTSLITPFPMRSSNRVEVIGLGYPLPSDNSTFFNLSFGPSGTNSLLSLVGIVHNPISPPILNMAFIITTSLVLGEVPKWPKIVVHLSC